MRNLPIKANRKFRYLLLALIAIGITGCSDDDDDEVTSQPTGTINVEDQTISGNTLKLTSVTVNTRAWLVVRKVNDDGSFTDMLAERFLLAGTRNDMKIELDNNNAPGVDLEDGDTLVLMLYADDGDGVLEIQENSGQDIPFRNEAGNVLSETFVISSPFIEIEDQEVVNKTITFTNILSANKGWIVLYNSTATGTLNEFDIIGFSYLNEGDNMDTVVTLNEAFIYTPGKIVFARIHWDNPDDEEFSYSYYDYYGYYADNDLPEIFGFGADPRITESFIIN